MAQSQGWVKRYFKAFCKGFFVAVPVAVTFLDRVACVARVEGASMQPSLNPGGSRSSDVVLLNHWKVRNFEVQRGDIVSLVCPQMRRNSSGRGRPALPCSFHCCLWVKPWRIYRYPSCTHPPEMIFDQSLIYFDLPVCPATQGKLWNLFNQLT
ncbi:mitochondrial inner membrane protease subunit 2 isoform X5 [Castor canadensis]|uniref:Mitochondrial inner membrane protease subunit 2 isoform X5 n=1 Tax=Castor canadensis TaxID=51338 RepID=A0AC58LVK1_CASCN